MKTKIFILSIIASFIIIYGCDFSGHTISIDQETKDYCLFRQGSYWVYQDSATQITDSVVIKTTPYFSTSKGSGTTDEWEYYNYGTEVYVNNICTPFSSSIEPGRDSKHETQKPIWAYFNVLPDSLFYYYSYHNGSLGEAYFGGTWSVSDYFYIYSKYESFLENYSINNVTYSNVKVFLLNMPANNDANSPYYTIPFMKLYWAKHIGLIRIENFSDSTNIKTKNLIRYDVENYEN